MMDDTGVPVISGMPYAAGWRTESVRVAGRTQDVFVSPDGQRYARALVTERADLIVRSESKRFQGGLLVRFRLQSTGALGKKVRKEQQATTQRAKRVRRKR